MRWSPGSLKTLLSMTRVSRYSLMTPMSASCLFLPCLTCLAGSSALCSLRLKLSGSYNSRQQVTFSMPLRQPLYSLMKKIPVSIVLLASLCCACMQIAAASASSVHMHVMLVLLAVQGPFPFLTSICQRRRFPSTGTQVRWLLIPLFSSPCAGGRHYVKLITRTLRNFRHREPLTHPVTTPHKSRSNVIPGGVTHLQAGPGGVVSWTYLAPIV